MFCANLLPLILPFPKQDKINWHHDHWVALIASCGGKIVHNRQPLVKYRQHSVNVVGATEDVGNFYRELGIWITQKGRITGNSYLVHKNLSESLYNRLDEKPCKNLFDERVTDFGLRILLLGIYSFVVNYQAEGTAARLFVLKFLLDLNKLIRHSFICIYR